MTRLNVSLDSPSPVLSYSPPNAWLPLTDQSINGYYANSSTAAVSLTVGAKMEVSFNGSGIWVYGAKSTNHGFYNVTLDGVASSTSFDGYADPPLYQVPLFSASYLSPGLHTLSLVNAGPYTGSDATRVWLDIDWVTFAADFEPSSQSASNSTTVITDTYTSSNSSLKYQTKGGGWTACSYTGLIVSNGSCMITTTSGDNVNFTFTGDAVALYGGAGPRYGDYLVSLDGAPVQNKSATYDYNEVHEQVLFYANSLGPGEHTVYVENSIPAGNASQNVFELDFIRTWSLEGGSGNGQQPGSPSHKSRTNAGAIAGGVVGGVVFLLLLSALLLITFRRRRRRIEFEEKETAPEPFVLLSASGSSSPTTATLPSPSVPEMTSNSNSSSSPSNPSPTTPNRPQPFTKSPLLPDPRTSPVTATATATSSSSISNAHTTPSAVPSSTPLNVDASTTSTGPSAIATTTTTTTTTAPPPSQLPTIMQQENSSRAEDYGLLIREGDPYGVPELPPDYEHAQQPWEQQREREQRERERQRQQQGAGEVDGR